LLETRYQRIDTLQMAERVLRHEDLNLSQICQRQYKNAKLKRMYANVALMHHARKNVVDRKL